MATRIKVGVRIQNRPSRRERATNAPSKIADRAERESNIDTLKDAVNQAHFASVKTKNCRRCARRIARKKQGWITKNSDGLERIVLANHADRTYSRFRNGSSPTFGAIPFRVCGNGLRSVGLATVSKLAST